MESSSPDGRSWFVSTSYEFHDISDLVSGSDEIRDETSRDRKSQSLIVEASYGFNDRWSVAALLSAIEHTRKVGRASATEGRGIGDAIVMFKYRPRKIGLFDRNGLSFGFGARIPVGDDDQVDFVTLAEDMQPSTGAWGTVVWVQARHAFDQSARSQVFGSVSYSANFENERDYRFGNAWTLGVGGIYRTSTPWGFSGELRYRNAARDERNSVEIPNTGGEWLDFVPALQYHFNDNLAGKISGRIPVWRNVNDVLQFTTSYSVAVSVSYVFSHQ